MNWLPKIGQSAVPRNIGEKELDELVSKRSVVLLTIDQETEKPCILLPSSSDILRNVVMRSNSLECTADILQPYNHMHLEIEEKQLVVTVCIPTADNPALTLISMADVDKLKLQIMSAIAIVDRNVAGDVLGKNLIWAIQSWMNILIDENSDFWHNLRDNFTTKFASRRFRFDMMKLVQGENDLGENVDSALIAIREAEVKEQKEREKRILEKRVLGRGTAEDLRDSYIELNTDDRVYADSYDQAFATYCHELRGKWADIGNESRNETKTEVKIESKTSTVETKRIKDLDRARHLVLTALDELSLDDEAITKPLTESLKKISECDVKTVTVESHKANIALEELLYIAKFLSEHRPSLLMRLWAVMACSFKYYHYALQKEFVNLLSVLPEAHSVMSRYLTNYTIYLMYREESAIRNKSRSDDRFITSVKQMNGLGLRKCIVDEKYLPPLPFPPKITKYTKRAHHMVGVRAARDNMSMMRSWPEIKDTFNTYTRGIFTDIEKNDKLADVYVAGGFLTFCVQQSANETAELTDSYIKKVNNGAVGGWCVSYKKADLAAFSSIMGTTSETPQYSANDSQHDEQKSELKYGEMKCYNMGCNNVAIDELICCGDHVTTEDVAIMRRCAKLNAGIRCTARVGNAQSIFCLYHGTPASYSTIPGFSTMPSLPQLPSYTMIPGFSTMPSLWRNSPAQMTGSGTIPPLPTISAVPTVQTSTTSEQKSPRIAIISQAVGGAQQILQSILNGAKQPHSQEKKEMQYCQYKWQSKIGPTMACTLQALTGSQYCQYHEVKTEAKVEHIMLTDTKKERYTAFNLLYSKTDIDVPIFCQDRSDFLDKLNCLQEHFRKQGAAHNTVHAELFQKMAFKQVGDSMKYEVEIPTTAHPVRASRLFGAPTDKRNIILQAFPVYKQRQPTPFSLIFNFHVPPVRMYLDFKKDDIFMFPSCLLSLWTRWCIDLKYFASVASPVDIVIKYMDRGFYFILNDMENEGINEYTAGPYISSSSILKQLHNAIPKSSILPNTPGRLWKIGLRNGKLAVSTNSIVYPQ